MSNLPPPPPTPPNWYPDPDDDSRYRYWDGDKWTEHYAPRQLDDTNTPNKNNPPSHVKTQHADPTQTAPASDKVTPSSTVKEGGWKSWRRRHPVWHVIFWIFVGIVVLSMIGSALGDNSDDSTTRSTTTTVDERAEDRRKGFHCLSAWDGNHDGLEALIRDQLNDPGSMETIETRISPVDARGDHAILLEFTAKNAFGGRVRSIAAGVVDNSTCEATLSFIE